MDQPGLDLDLLAASIRADARDLGLFLEVLAGKLGEAIPGALSLEREGGLFARKRLKRLRVQLGEHSFALARSGQGLEATHAHTVRGITLRTEVVEVEEWIDLLSRELAEHARSSADARNALNSLLR